MSNSVASSVNQKLSEYEIMQMVFSDLRSNRPKSFDVHDFNGLPVHRRYNICLPNMAVWKSMPNLPSVDDIQKPSEIDVLSSFPEHKRAVSCPNMALLKNFRSLPELCKSAGSLPDMDVGENYSGDAPEIESPLDTSEVLAITSDSLCTESSMTPAAAPEQDSGIETSLLLVSPSFLRLQKLEDDMLLMLTDTVGRSDDEGTDPALTSDTPRRPRRSLWRRTKAFMRRMFCCGAVDV